MLSKSPDYTAFASIHKHYSRPANTTHRILFNVLTVKKLNDKILHEAKIKRTQNTLNIINTVVTDNSPLTNPSINSVNPLECKGNYSATSNNMKLVHWPLMDGLLHLVQRGGDWAGPQPAQAPPRCTKCNSPSINAHYTNRGAAV